MLLSRDSISGEHKYVRAFIICSFVRVCARLSYHCRYQQYIMYIFECMLLSRDSISGVQK